MKISAACSGSVASVSTGHCVDLMLSAQAELSALMCAVDRSHGGAAAHIAGEYWLAELEGMDESFQGSAREDWRRLTIAAISKLERDGRLPKMPSPRSDVVLSAAVFPAII